MGCVQRLNIHSRLAGVQRRQEREREREEQHTVVCTTGERVLSVEINEATAVRAARPHGYKNMGCADCTYSIYLQRYTYTNTHCVATVA
jgi:hypothetical protein